MKLRKILALCVSVMMILAVLAGCGSAGKDDSNNAGEQTGKQEEQNANETATYTDGIYFAQEDNFNEKTGWKSIVTLEVKDGKITSADWNAIHKNAGEDKKTQSENGKYGMVANGNAQAEWHEQAEKVEAYLIDKQDPTAIEYKDEEGHTDAISGVSVHVNDFFALAAKALANGPIEKGPYKDGAYHAEQESFDEKSGWKSTVDLTVVNGLIVAANWSGVHKDGGDDKKTLSQNGGYPMVAQGGAKAEWHEQAAKVEAYLLEKQDPTAIEYKDEAGNVDAISGVSIHVKEFFELAAKALNEAK